ncbi:MAG: adenylate/guanylate cyclase domain-containing protein [Aeromicrobium sp.]
MTTSVRVRRGLDQRAPASPTDGPDARPFRLRFPDAELDREFRQLYDTAAVPQAVMVGIVGFVVTAAFGVLDAFMFPATGLFVIRFGIICPVIVVFSVVLVLARERAWRFVQAGMCAVMIVGAFGLFAMPFVSEVPDDFARTSSLLIIMFLCAFAPVRFVWAMWTIMVIFAGYQGASLALAIPWNIAVYNSFFLVAFIVIGGFTSYTLERLRRREFLRERALEQERARSDALLHNILPEEIATRLRTEPGAIAEAADEVSVLFADIVGFTPFAEALPPDEVVKLLDGLFTVFDDLCGQHGVEKIKTIGDAYMAVAGVPRPDPDHAVAIAELALDMQAATVLFAEHWPGPLALRIGISSGPVVAGVIGHRKFAYDLWGDTVNTASRMESHGTPGRIHVSGTTHALLDDRYMFGEPQVTQVKGKGTIETYLLRGRKPEVVEPGAKAAAGAV